MWRNVMSAMCVLLVVGCETVAEPEDQDACAPAAPYPGRLTEGECLAAAGQVFTFPEVDAPCPEGLYLLGAVLSPAPSAVCCKFRSMTREECEAFGGGFEPAPGGPAECAEDEIEVGSIAFGIEGAACCYRL
jgi:hypothetical protein